MLAERTVQREGSGEYPRTFELHYSASRVLPERRPALAISREDVGGLGGSFAEASHGAIGRPER